jgi:hypothetical protein
MPNPQFPEYTPEQRQRILDHVCDEIAKKRPLYKVLAEDEGMPSYSRFMAWRAESREVQDRIAQAREDALEAIVEEIIEISDESNHDPYIAHDAHGKPYAKIDGDCIQRAKLRVYAREKAAALLAPRRFGQKVDVTSDGKALAPAQVTLNDNRVQSLLMLVQQRRDTDAMLEG